MDKRLRAWLGPVVLVTVIFIGGMLLEFFGGTGQSVALGHAFLILGVVLAAVDFLLVYRPTRRMETELAELQSRCRLQEGALTGLLESFRHGDLVTARDSRRDLPATIGEAAEAAIMALGALVQQIQEVSVEVAAAANGIRATAEDLASGSSEQAASLVEISATMEELARTAAQIASNASSQADMAEQSEAAGRDGAGAIESAVVGIESARERMNVIALRAETLDSRSREIYRILDLINEIAQETHILSLNAAIEASTAGEYGERFAVVAREVRRLAERSRESVENVRNLLHEFTTAIRSVVVATEEGGKTVDTVLDQARASAAAIEELSAALGGTAHAAREISLATQEQRAASQEVLTTVREESDVITQIASGLEEFTGAASRLNQLALSIQLLSQSFRLESSHSLKHLVFGIARSLEPLFGNLEAMERVLTNIFSEFPYVEMAYVVDSDGLMIVFAINRDLVEDDAGEGVAAVGQSYADRPWFQSVGRENRSAVTPVYTSLLTGDRCFTVVVSIEERQGGRQATLGVDVNVANWVRI